jgi:hypothetical protein
MTEGVVEVPAATVAKRRRPRPKPRLRAAALSVAAQIGPKKRCAPITGIKFNFRRFDPLPGFRRSLRKYSPHSENM